jgi:hypothetical protein
MHKFRCKLFFATLLSGVCTLVSANSSKPGELREILEGTRSKATLSSYTTDDGNSATDANFRTSLNAHTGWIGHYRDGQGFEQTRSGYEYNFSPAWGQVVASVQSASMGFFGSSLNAEIGKENSLLLGLGRTNLKDYYNLNFDPNDSVTYGVSTHAWPRLGAYLFTVQDNRLNPDQRHTHLMVRYETGNGQSWSFDVLQKSGKVDDNDIHAIGSSFTYDFGTYFLRIADDPYVNFSSQRMTRASLGMQF